jgi:hypothetical protein
LSGSLNAALLAKQRSRVAGARVALCIVYLIAGWFARDRVATPGMVMRRAPNSIGNLRDQIRAEIFSLTAPILAHLERDSFSSNRHPALAYC